MSDEKMDIKKDKNLDYNFLLDRIYMSFPEKTLETSRFEVPRIDAMIQGKQTFWKNFSKVAKDLNREPKHLYKFVLKEISTSSTLVDGKLVLSGIFNNYKLNQILNKYIKTFVLCTACKKPDTKFDTQNGVKVLRCSACGAISPVPQL